MDFTSGILVVVVISFVILVLIYYQKKSNVSFDQEVKKSSHVSYPKPNTEPTFDRQSTSFDRFHVESSNVSVGARMKSNTILPTNWAAATQWPGKVGGVYDQERCGSCWAFATTNQFSDRLKIKYGESILPNGDYISPFHLAACIKCGVNGACPRVCEGSYLDEVCQYLVTDGAIGQNTIDKYSKQEDEYRCFDFAKYNVKPHKAKSKYRVNLYPPSMLKKNQELMNKNEEAIRREIFDNGPVSCIIKVFTPMDSRNFYTYNKGIYGSGWKSDPKETEGYHAINIIGWGEDKTSNGVVKYWIVRNSWGNTWGTDGLGRVLRGKNLGMIESDVWALEV
jgi:cathepsin B